MGMDFRVDDMDFALILPAVTAGSLDAGASGFTDNAERRESFDFVDFLYAGVQWAAQPGSGVDPSDPCGLTVSVQRTTVSETDDGRPKSEACEAAAREAGVQRLYLETNSGLRTAIALYERFGFVHLPARPTPYARADVFMEKRL